MTKAHATWVIHLSLLIALLFVLLPIPMDWRFLRPDIAALVLFYWALALPHRVGVATAFALGMGLDLIEGAPLGLSSPGLMLATLILQFNYQRIRQFDPIQQSVVMLVLMSLSTGTEQWLRNVTGVPALSAGALTALLLSMACWIPLRAVLRHSRRYYEVY